MRKMIFAFCGAALLSAVAVPVSVVAITAASDQASAQSRISTWRTSGYCYGRHVKYLRNCHRYKNNPR
jgi:hypothetical protein